MAGPDARTPYDATKPAAASVRDLVVTYRSSAGSAAALDGVDADLGSRRLSVVAGPSGSGKSSLLRVLAGLVAPASGSVVVDGTDLTRMGPAARRRFRRTQLGVVLQSPVDNLVPYLDVAGQLDLAARMRGPGLDGGEELLETLGLTDRRGSGVAELSGGEQQRVAFAVAAVGRPSVLLADEPTAQLDRRSGTQVVSAMRALVDGGASLVVTSHDEAVIDAADEVLWLRDGRVAAS